MGRANYNYPGKDGRGWYEKTPASPFYTPGNKERVIIMELIEVAVTEDELAKLEKLASDYSTTPGELLSAFVSDLTASSRSAGVTNEELADEWLDEQDYRW